MPFVVEPAASASRRDGRAVGPWTLAAALYGLAYLCWERTGWGGEELRGLVGNVAFMPLNLLVAGLNALAARNPELAPGTRRALRLLALASLAVFVGNCISVWFLVARDATPPVSPADAFYLADVALMLAALLALPLSRRLSLEWWKFVLDAAMVLTGGGVLIWFFAVRPTAAQSTGAVESLLAFAFPLADLLLLLGITTVLLRKPIDGNRTAFRLLVAGMLVSIVGDLAFGLVQAETNARSAAWTDAAYLLSYLLLVASAELYRRDPVAWREPVGEADGAHPLSPLPYLAVGATFAVLLFATVRHWTTPVGPLALAAVASTCLVLVRQVLAVRQNVRLLAEATARQNAARFRSLVQHASDVILVVDRARIIRYASPSAARVLRYDPERLLERDVTGLVPHDDRDRTGGFLREVVGRAGVHPAAEWRFIQPDGAPLHAEVTATNLLDDPAVQGVVLNVRDVSERRRLEQELLHQAFHDPLTGLANRALFRDRVSHALALARRRYRGITVLFVDLDDFKKVNDSLGHAEGDRLLVAAAERFRSCARAADTVARLGGDEFAILVEEMTGPDDEAALVDRLMAAMAQPFVLAGTEVFVSASIGLATAAWEETADDVLRNADMAMYTAKRGGKGRCATYQAHMYADVRERLELEAALRTALDSGQLEAHYQPVVDLASGHVTGLEALVRWRHPRRGLLGPQEFIQLAEETGLVTRVGQWMLREACRQAVRWRRAYPGRGLTVAVNVSGRQLLDADVVEDTRAALVAAGIEPGAIVLEITESVLMQHTAGVLERLRDLKTLGVGLAIDDFGTGYSSLSYLQRFPIDTLKIARPFIEDVGVGGERAALARAIIGLGDTLRLATIAEGIETPEQRAALVDLGCRLGQGYLFAPPLPAADVDRLLAGAALGQAPLLRVV